jgi:hypothetical protein
MTRIAGKFMIAAGLIIAGLGIIFLFRDSLPFLKYFGRLPGDILIKKDNFTFYFPLMTGILVSIVLSLIMYILSRVKL